eukprot:15365220-Ditylum_brightwellii.AAC.2
MIPTTCDSLPTSSKRSNQCTIINNNNIKYNNEPKDNHTEDLFSGSQDDSSLRPSFQNEIAYCRYIQEPVVHMTLTSEQNIPSTNLVNRRFISRTKGIKKRSSTTIL